MARADEWQGRIAEALLFFQRRRLQRQPVWRLQSATLLEVAQSPSRKLRGELSIRDGPVLRFRYEPPKSLQRTRRIDFDPDQIWPRASC